MIAAILIMVIFTILLVMAMMKMASICSRIEEEKEVQLNSNRLFCNEDCSKCDQWDWCPLSDRRK